MNLISSPELLTPPKPTVATDVATNVARQILLFSPPRARMPYCVSAAKGAAPPESSPLTPECSPATLTPRKSPAFAAKKVQVPLCGVKSTFNYAPAVKHPKGQSVDILGINRADRGRHCEEHDICGHSLEENSLVRIRREVFATKDKGKIVEQAALSVYSVDMGVDRCRVGFLPHAYVQTGTLFDGVLCQASIFFLMHCIIRLPSSNLRQSYLR